jgi:hypothetical protein
MWESGGRWHGRLTDPPSPARVKAPSRAACLRGLRDAAGPEALLTVEVAPELVGVAETAAILRWDKRRIFTYLGRGSFPEPFAALASGRIWLRSDIEAFARRRPAGSGRARTR